MRLPGSQPRESRYVLCTAAVAADFQTTAHDFGIREVFPDCSLFSRRRSAGGSTTGIHAGRYRNVVSVPRIVVRFDRRVVLGGELELDLRIGQLAFELAESFFGIGADRVGDLDPAALHAKLHSRNLADYPRESHDLDPAGSRLAQR